MTGKNNTASGLSIYRPYQSARLLLLQNRYWWHLATLLVVGDLVLTQLIIRFIRFTEIDYETYMEQVSVYEAGIRDYTLLKGPTGPLVYPAGHVYIHKVLRDITTNAQGIINVRLAQQIYGAIYIITLGLTCWVYKQAGGVPNYVMIPLVLSKRIHSIYVLRLFNDCWAIMFLMASIAAYNAKKYTFGSLLISVALSVKMNILLYVPGLLVALICSVGLWKTAFHMTIIAGFQILVALPFLATYPTAYLANAFNLGRAFLYKWTVNWRFIPENEFLSKGFARGLLACHAIALIAFGFRWCEIHGGVLTVVQRALGRPYAPAGNPIWTKTDHFTTVLFTSNLIGIAFARSLHYQFYSWYAYQIPFLLWRTEYPLTAKIGLMLLIEYCWNVFPSTKYSSFLLFYCHLVLLAGLYVGHADGLVVQPTGNKQSQKRN